MPNGENEARAEIRSVIDRWTQAVRAHDYDGVLAGHDDDMVMFDVPPPMQSRGLDEYRKTWDLFFKYHTPGHAFDISEIEIVAGEDVAFAYALMRCGGTSGHEGFPFRLTLGFRKKEGAWTIVHEHHSVPAEN